MGTVALGSDPNAQEYKEAVAEHLKAKGFDIYDLGAEDAVYANVAIELASAVADGKYEKGVLICGTGIGMSIAANKVNGAYAALLTDCYSASRARKSNNANIACLGTYTIGIRHALELIDIFLGCEYEYGGPSQKKIDRITEYEIIRK